MTSSKKKALRSGYNLGDRVEPTEAGYYPRGQGTVVGYADSGSVLVMHDDWDRGHNGNGGKFPLMTKGNSSWYYQLYQIAHVNTEPTETNPWWDL